MSDPPAQPRAMLSCLVAFAAPLVSLGVLAALAGSPGVRARIVPGTRRAILEGLAREPADVLVLGTQLGCGTGVSSLLAHLRAESSPPRIVVLVPKFAAHLCPALRSAGATATLPLEIEPALLVDALQSRADTGDTVTGAARHPRPDSTAGSVDLSVLSTSKLEIFHQIGTGATPRVIAARLGISPKTVESHRANIKVKLGVRSPAVFNDIARAWVLWDSSGIDYVI